MKVSEEEEETQSTATELAECISSGKELRPKGARKYYTGENICQTEA